jgi:predicted GNAT family acetyltransferase
MMEKFEPLNNPVWVALNSGNAQLAQGGASARSFQERISPFVGLRDFSKHAFDALETIPTELPMAVVSKDFVTPTNTFEILQREKILQMVFNKETVEPLKMDSVKLNTLHVPLMLELTQLTRPGPFLDHTIRFGNYFGIFESERLAAMAGRRFHADRFIEISAVCTHPNFSGRGYAGKLMLAEVVRILLEDSTPYLHVRPGNEGAIRLYQKLGFDIHQEVNLLVFKK